MYRLPLQILQSNRAVKIEKHKFKSSSVNMPAEFWINSSEYIDYTSNQVSLPCQRRLHRGGDLCSGSWRVEAYILPPRASWERDLIGPAVITEVMVPRETFCPGTGLGGMMVSSDTAQGWLVGQCTEQLAWRQGWHQDYFFTWYCYSSLGSDGWAFSFHSAAFQHFG